MIYHGTLTRPRQYLDNRYCCRRAQGAPQGRRTVSGGRLQCKPVGAGGPPEGRGYRGGYVGALPPAPALMLLGREDMEYDTGGDGGAVSDGLHSGDG